MTSVYRAIAAALSDPNPRKIETARFISILSAFNFTCTVHGIHCTCWMENGWLRYRLSNGTHELYDTVNLSGWGTLRLYDALFSYLSTTVVSLEIQR